MKANAFGPRVRIVPPRAVEEHAAPKPERDLALEALAARFEALEGQVSALLITLAASSERLDAFAQRAFEVHARTSEEQSVSARQTVAAQREVAVKLGELIILLGSPIEPVYDDDGKLIGAQRGNQRSVHGK